jgi:hypothetical protein
MVAVGQKLPAVSPCTAMLYESLNSPVDPKVENGRGVLILMVCALKQFPS